MDRLIFINITRVKGAPNALLFLNDVTETVQVTCYATTDSANRISGVIMCNANPLMTLIRLMRRVVIDNFVSIGPGACDALSICNFWCGKKSKQNIWVRRCLEPSWLIMCNGWRRICISKYANFTPHSFTAPFILKYILLEFCFIICNPETAHPTTHPTTHLHPHPTTHRARAHK